MFDFHGDPRTDQLFMMSSPLPAVIIISIYLTSVYKILPKFMETRQSFNLKRIIFVYNIFQITSCTLFIYYIVTPIENPHLSAFCESMDFGNDSRSLLKLKICYLGYLMKFVELLDTVFFILRKKFNQVSGLHVFHHSSMVLIGWLVVKCFGGGMTTFALMINSFVHALMYSYYLLVSLGDKWSKLAKNWKSSLTILQMIQFVILFAHGLQGLNPKCRTPKPILFLCAIQVAIFFKMFYNFFKNSDASRKNVINYKFIPKQ